MQTVPHDSVNHRASEAGTLNQDVSVKMNCEQDLRSNHFVNPESHFVVISCLRSSGKGEDKSRVYDAYYHGRPSKPEARYVACYFVTHFNAPNGNSNSVIYNLIDGIIDNIYNS